MGAIYVFVGLSKEININELITEQTHICMCPSECPLCEVFDWVNHRCVVSHAGRQSQDGKCLSFRRSHLDKHLPGSPVEATVCHPLKYALCSWQNLYCFDDILIKETARVKPEAPRFLAKSPRQQQYSPWSIAIWIWGFTQWVESGVWVIYLGLEFAIRVTGWITGWLGLWWPKIN